MLIVFKINKWMLININKIIIIININNIKINNINTNKWITNKII